MLTSSIQITDCILSCSEDYNFDRVTELIKSGLPAGLKDNERLVGNTFYRYAIEVCNSNIYKFEFRMKLQEYLFDNFRFSGTLDKYTNII